MPKCANCGKKFDVDDARNEYDAYDEWAGDLTYDEEIADPYDEGIKDHSICGSCAINLTLEDFSAGRAMQFSLETGLPPEDMPDDWSPSADGGIAPW